MKSKHLWINLAVRDVANSRSFYQAIGFELNTRYGNSEDSASLIVSEQEIVLMLFRENSFRKFINSEVADLAQGNEVLFSLSADSPEEVYEMSRLVIAAGGQIFAEPGEEHGWMVGMGFADPDGHKWNVLFMDLSKAPSGR